VSIYATLWQLKIPRDGYWSLDDEQWVEVYAQAVPPHIGHPRDYPEGDPYTDFLPPPCADADGPLYRAVVLCDELTAKGTPEHGQQYVNPVLVLTGEEYAAARFDELLQRIGEAIAERWMPRQTCPTCQREVLAGPTATVTCAGDGGHVIIQPVR
jgi:hypothetical protein